MIRSRLHLRGIRASGHHGARPGEQDEPQPFEIDLELWVEVADDTIGSTADYRRLVERTREIVERESFDLIESMAARIADEVAGLEHVVGATAIVHKPDAARRLEVADVTARASAGDVSAGG
jgi:dihydroneopterin aldolase